MADIAHSLHIDGPIEQVHHALATIDGLSSWWTSTTEGESAEGANIGFRFGSHLTTARVDTLSAERIAWTLIDSNPDWIGTRITFDLSVHDGKTLVRFGHVDWRAANDFMAHCSMKWAIFLLSLKGLIETGAGKPFPNDIRI